METQDSASAKFGTEESEAVDVVPSNATSTTPGSPKLHRAGLGGKRLSGRHSKETMAQTSWHSFGEAAKSAGFWNGEDTPQITPTNSWDLGPGSLHHESSTDANQSGHVSVMAQVAAWIKAEKDRRASRRVRRNEDDSKKPDGHSDATVSSSPLERTESTASNKTARRRRGSDASDGSNALEQLEKIVKKSITTEKRRGSVTGRLRRHSWAKLSTRETSSGADGHEHDPTIPSCDAVLDNSKTLSFRGGSSQDMKKQGEQSKVRQKSFQQHKQAWSAFKYEILRLTHTLRLKGWRWIHMDRSDEIEVHRLSGAMTNAIYVVSPPPRLGHRNRAESTATGTEDSSAPSPTLRTRKQPPKLLLRIYGPQVSHLIDREGELQILRRLSRQRIGPRLLGTFSNGRFEEFLHARPLTAAELRHPPTSMAIAKRMKELHVGIKLLEWERIAGPFVFTNWDKWVERCGNIVRWCDQQQKQVSQGRADADANESTDTSAKGGLLNTGYVCGTEWAQFYETVQKYRKWLYDQYGGENKINEKLIFAHNDTQYGNIMRQETEQSSPLLLPENRHRQLVVIDFEYSNANLPGLEFANHFTEWCYNYHDENRPHALNQELYPSVPEQRRFIRAYLDHKFQRTSYSSLQSHFTRQRHGGKDEPGPEKDHGQATSDPANSLTSSISTLMLDQIGESGQERGLSQSRFGHKVAQDSGPEAGDAGTADAEVDRLITETRLWRLANSAQWVAWGVVQAKVPGMPSGVADEQAGAGDGNGGTVNKTSEAKQEPAAKEESSGGETSAGEEVDDEGEFDYLAYARERAMFFWGDAVQLGIVKKENLPKDVQANLKFAD